MLQEVQPQIAGVPCRGGSRVFACTPKADKEVTGSSSPWFESKKITIRSHETCVAKTSYLATSNVGSASISPQPTKQYYTRNHSSRDGPCKFSITYPHCFNARAF